MQFIKLAKEIENLQHGFSSGNDIIACTKKESIIYKKKNLSKKKKLFFKINIINTGKTKNSTGESVIKILKFLENKKFISDSIKTSYNIKKTINKNKNKNFKKLIKINNTILYKIKIISINTMKYILNSEINLVNIKISGAGSYYGKNSGIIFLKNKKYLNKLTKIFNFKKIKEE